MAFGSQHPRKFEDIGKIPAPGDNVAVATERLEAGTEVEREGSRFTVKNTVLEGHRFAVDGIPADGELLSWGLPFGTAVRDIPPGDYVCNPKILQALADRNVDFELPSRANFRDGGLAPYNLHEEEFQPGVRAPRHEEVRYFLGYRRGGGRGVGTRNYVVVVGTTSRTSSYAKALEERMKGAADEYENVDGVVAVAHTEGGGSEPPNNLDLLLRTLSGFVVNPNVGAVLAVDYATEVVTNQMLEDYLSDHGYPLEDVPHRFMSLEGGFEESLRKGEAVVRELLPRADETSRTEEPVSELKIALQCGGSDAFSGISGNPLAAWVAKEVIRQGGGANLAETDELIGAEHYVLENVRDLETARKFLSMVERFKEHVGRHGHTAEGNPSGGNNYRGLYNISIKSIGAALKRHPDARLDHVIEYAERMSQPGFHFMDSPGNDLESVAGQVASGCNAIFFTTGNGSITNFPFVPTVKIVTTTGRYELLRQDMDVNAGAYLDGTPMEELGRDLLDLTLRTASGERTVGERAGHSQVHIWRDWRQPTGEDLEHPQQEIEPDGSPLPIETGVPRPELAFDAVRKGGGYAADGVALIMPTSLCSGQIARRIASLLNEGEAGQGYVTRFVALPHTEGCGVSAGSSERLYSRTVLGYLSHPSVKLGLLLEHGCEKTHNDYFRKAMRERGLSPERFGWASVQLDGGIEKVVRRVEEWFTAALPETGALSFGTVGLEALRLGLYSADPLPPEAAESLAQVTREIVASGGTVVVPEKSSLLEDPVYLKGTLGDLPVERSLAYGQAVIEPGFHVMETPTDHPSETATGLGATGVETMLAYVEGHPVQAHRMVPLLQVTADPKTYQLHGEDLDLALRGEPSGWADRLLESILSVAGREYRPKLHRGGDTDFQITRGLLGVSM